MFGLENSTSYERHKAKMAEVSRAKSRNAREIAPDFPQIENPQRREQALASFKAFCQSYFPATFHLPFSNDHDTAIRKIEQAVMHGGLFAFAMPRGSGKSSLCQAACLWAALSGRHRFIMLVGATESHGTDILAGIKTALETNDLLAEDFPEICYPIHRLEGIAQRRLLWKGEQVRMKFTDKRVVFPNLPPNPAASCCIGIAGITGRLRGAKFSRPDGTEARPSFVLVDDPQDRESAESASQCHTREKIIAGDILGMAGPGEKISAVMPCTVIRPGDLCDTLLNRRRHPAWAGERAKMLYGFPMNVALWDQYFAILDAALADARKPTEASDFYAANREAMDAGAIVAWPERKNDDELSGLEHAMRLLHRDRPAFMAEYQNTPLADDLEAADSLTADQITQKINGLPRGTLPGSCTVLTAFVDVGEHYLHYCVSAFDLRFTGAVIAYGQYPEGRRTLAHQFPGKGVEGAIYAGLQTLTNALLGREWPQQNGLPMRIERCGIDAGHLPGVVQQFIQESPFAGTLLPCKGFAISAKSPRPFELRQPKPGERQGESWYIGPTPGGRRLLQHENNHWKSALFARLATAQGDVGSLSLYGKSPAEHATFAAHLKAEYRTLVTANGRSVWEYQLRPEKPPNHLFDAAVGTLVMASLSGCKLLGPMRRAPSGPKKSWSQRQREKLERQAG